MNPKEELKKEIKKCPFCGGENIIDISTYASNGLYGAGGYNWKETDLRACADCGIVMIPFIKLREEDK
jgi:hypothetical protein